MRVPSRFVVTIHGDVHRIIMRGNLEPKALSYLLDRLLTGSDVAESALSAFGIRIWIDRDTDQGDD